MHRVYADYEKCLCVMAGFLPRGGGGGGGGHRVPLEAGSLLRNFCPQNFVQSDRKISMTIDFAPLRKVPGRNPEGRVTSYYNNLQLQTIHLDFQHLIQQNQESMKEIRNDSFP